MNARLFTLFLVMHFCMVSLYTQQVRRSDAEILQEFANRPLHFSPSGMRHFFMRTFRSQLYGTRFLPSCFVHVTDFLAHSKKTENPCLFAQAVISSFHNALKKSTWTNPYALATLLEELPPLVAPFCIETHQSIKEIIKQELYQALRYNFEELQNNPESFLEKTAETITIKIASPTEQILVRELQYSLARFIESALDKLLFDPNEQEYTWKITILLAEHLQALEKSHIIDERTLNQLYWSLLERFVYFINSTGSLLHPATYTLIQENIKTASHHMLHLEEEEAFFVKKSVYLQKALDRGMFKAHAREKGIVAY
jgi:hypothetical protein